LFGFEATYVAKLKSKLREDFGVGDGAVQLGELKILWRTKP
jgi:hypothetical protein